MVFLHFCNVMIISQLSEDKQQSHNLYLQNSRKQQARPGTARHGRGRPCARQMCRKGKAFCKAM